MVDLEEFVKNKEVVTSAEEVVDVWIFHVENCPKPLKIKVVKSYPSAPNPPFTGLANLRIRNPAQLSPYRSIHPRSSV